jgi:hypothetical protein
MEKFERQTIKVDSLPAALRIKWPGEVLAEGFVPFPKRLLRNLSPFFGDDPGLKELAALLAVVDFKRPNPTRKPSMEYLAFIAGLDDVEFSDAIARLSRKGLLTVQGHDDDLDTSIEGLVTALGGPTKSPKPPSFPAADNTPPF